MMIVPIDELKEKIVENSDISMQELNSKITSKMEELSGLISEEGAAHIIANELNVKIIPETPSFKVKDMQTGVRNIEIFGKVLRIFDVREFQSHRGPGKVGSFLFGDETGTMRAVLWNDQTSILSNISENDVVHIKSGYVRENNGRRELHLNDRSEVKLNPEGVKIDVKTFENVRKQVKDLSEQDESVEILVTVVDIYDLRYFTVCPECNRKAIEQDGSFQCQTHGTVTPSVSYVLNLVGDDGTGTVRITLWKSQAERFLGLDSEKLKSFKDNPENFQEYKHKLLGEMVKFIGRVNKNQMFDRLEFSANLVFMNPDPKEELEKA